MRKKSDGITKLLVAILIIAGIGEAGLLGILGLDMYQTAKIKEEYAERKALEEAERLEKGNRKDTHSFSCGDLIIENGVEIWRAESGLPRPGSTVSSTEEPKPVTEQNTGSSVNQEESAASTQEPEKTQTTAPAQSSTPSSSTGNKTPSSSSNNFSSNQSSGITISPSNGTQTSNSSNSSGSSSSSSGNQSSGITISPSNGGQTSGNSSASNTSKNTSANADITVYVSNYGKIHKISNCSGMKNYTMMTLSEAIAAENEYFKDCW